MYPLRRLPKVEKKPARKPFPPPPKRLPDRVSLYRKMGSSVTVCIAVKARMDHCIITVSDKRLSYGDELGAADNAATKAHQIGRRWGILWSADDVSPVNELLREIHYRLHDKPNADRSLVQEIVCAAYNEAQQKAAVDRYLLRFGIHSVAEFRKTGLAEFGPEMFGQIMGEIGSFDLGVQLLVHGFSPPPFESFLHIFEVRNPGISFDHNLEGYGVIGTGGSLALSSLMIRGGGFADFDDAVYRALEAKFAAETASGVGRATTVEIHASNGTTTHLPTSAIGELRAVWEAARKEGIPDEASNIIDKHTKALKNLLYGGPDT